MRHVHSTYYNPGSCRRKVHGIACIKSSSGPNPGGVIQDVVAFSTIGITMILDHVYCLVGNISWYLAL